MKLSGIVRSILTVAAAATLLLPVDSLPDIVPLIGWVDDFIAVGYLITEFLRFMARRKERPVPTKDRLE